MMGLTDHWDPMVMIEPMVCPYIFKGKNDGAHGPWYHGDHEKREGLLMLGRSHHRVCTGDSLRWVCIQVAYLFVDQASV